MKKKLTFERIGIILFCMVLFGTSALTFGKGILEITKIITNKEGEAVKEAITNRKKKGGGGKNEVIKISL